MNFLKFLILFSFFEISFCKAQNVLHKGFYPKNKEIDFAERQDSTQKPQAFLPKNFATCNDGFFCKQELKLEKKINVPIKFRLGSFEQVNWLEGKSRYKPEK